MENDRIGKLTVDLHWPAHDLVVELDTDLLGGLAKQLKRPFKWDPLAEKCVNDEEATRFLSIAKRDPWRI